MLGETPRTEIRTALFDSRRWKGFEPRPDDIFIVTPAKCGTTWTQGIVTSLVFPDGDAPMPAAAMSPWLDQRARPLADVMADVDSMEHRRYIKSHLPPDALPLFDQCSYLAVFRSSADALLSAVNHRRNMRPDRIRELNDTAVAEGLPPMAEHWDGDLHALIDENEAFGLDPVTHLASWWPRRNEVAVRFVHYDDLNADLEGEMRGIAEFLGIEIAEEQWPAAVGRCRIDAMRADHDRGKLMDGVFEGGAKTFFHRGETGRGTRELPPDVLDRLVQREESTLPPDALEWLRNGSIRTGRRP